MASNGPSHHVPSLRLGLTAPQPSRCHHAQSLQGPSFHDPRTPHVLESHPKRVAPLSRRDDERRHGVVFHSALAMRLYHPRRYKTSSIVIARDCQSQSCWFDPGKTQTIPRTQIYLNLSCINLQAKVLNDWPSNKNNHQLMQPATCPQVVALESGTISAQICFNRCNLAESLKPNF